MKQINWSEFEQVELRVGTILTVQEFLEARKPAYKVTADFGEEIGTLKSSAQITDLYSPEDLIGSQIVGVVNFPHKQIGPFMSQYLLTGFVQQDGSVVIAKPERRVDNGAKLA